MFLFENKKDWFFVIYSLYKEIGFGGEKMEVTSVLLGLIFLGILALIVITVTIGFKLKEFAIREEGVNEGIYQTLNSLKEKLTVIDREIENKIIKNIMTDLGKTKEDLINHLTVLKETIHETTNDLSSKNDSLSKETVQKLSEVEKEINKTIREVTQALNGTTTQIVTDVKNTIQGVNKEFVNYTKTLSEKLGKLDQKLEVVERISSEIKDLQDILKPPKQRGSFGEVLLENLIKDIFPKDMYEFQYSMGTDKVDAVLKIDGKILPIDSKFPLDNYLKVLNEGKSIDALVRDVRKMIDDISRKYIKPSEYNTTNFALMYIPSESVWYSLFVMNPSVFKYAVEKKVFPVSPNTLMSYLYVVLEGLRAFEIEKSVDSLISEINSLSKNIEEGINEFGKLEKHMRNSLNKIKSVKDTLVEISDKVNALGENSHLEKE